MKKASKISPILVFLILASTFYLFCHTSQTHSQSVPAVFFEMATSQNSESTTSAFVKVKLLASSSQTVKVDYQTSGGSAYPINEGTGKDYEPLKGTLTFSPGETEKNITLSITNDTINETDESFNILLSNPQNANLGMTTKHTYTIQDDDRAALINIKDAPYNAKGDGSTDDTAAIQAAVNAAYAAGGGGTGRGAVVVFPEGVYVTSSIAAHYNLTYEGYGATLKTPPMSGNWTHIFYLPFNGSLASYGYDSAGRFKTLSHQRLYIGWQ